MLFRSLAGVLLLASTQYIEPTEMSHMFSLPFFFFSRPTRAVARVGKRALSLPPFFS